MITMKVGHNEFTLRAEGGAIIKDALKRVFGGRLDRLDDGVAIVKEHKSTMSVPDFAIGAPGDALTGDQFDMRDRLYSLTVRADRLDLYRAPGATASSVIAALDGYNDVD